jgi:hypothetical protein
MTGDELIGEFATIVEQTCYPRFEPGTGAQAAITNEQWDTVIERLLRLAEKNKVRSDAA